MKSWITEKLGKFKKSAGSAGSQKKASTQKPDLKLTKGIGMKIKMKGNVQIAMEMANIIMLLQFVPKESFGEVYEKIKELVTIVNKGIIDCAISQKVFSKREYERQYKDRYIEGGIDTFPTMIGFVLGGNDIFVTQNKKLIKDSEILLERFGIEVLSQDEFIAQQTKIRDEMSKPPSYVG